MTRVSYIITDKLGNKSEVKSYAEAQSAKVKGCSYTIRYSTIKEPVPNSGKYAKLRKKS